MHSIFPAFKYKPNFKKRIFATLFDYGLYLLVFYAYILFFGHENEDGSQSVEGMLALPLLIFWFIYFVVLEAINGATPGHQIFQLKVLTLHRTNISLSHSLKRHLLDIVDILFYGIPAIIAIKSSDKHQRLGDMLANTIVVDISDPEQI
jgi:uncharacterized RDD family membrane protein YckC